MMVVGRVFREIVNLGMTTKGGDLDDFAAKTDVGETKAATDQKTVAEELLDLTRGSIGRHIEIFRGAMQEEIAHAAADKVGFEVLAAQAVQNFQGHFVKLFAGDVVFSAGEDNGQVGHNKRGSVKLAQTSRERSGIKGKSCRSRGADKKSGPVRSAKKREKYLNNPGVCSICGIADLLWQHVIPPSSPLHKIK
jgi:hypothetical protein